MLKRLIMRRSEVLDLSWWLYLFAKHIWLLVSKCICVVWNILTGPARQLQHSGGLDALRGKGGYLGKHCHHVFEDMLHSYCLL